MSWGGGRHALPHETHTQFFHRETLARKILTLHSGLEIFYFLANYVSFPGFFSIRMHGEVILRDREPRKDHSCVSPDDPEEGNAGEKEK